MVYNILGVKIKYIESKKLWYIYGLKNYDIFMFKPDLTMILNFIN